MCTNISIGNFIASQDEKGNWIYKAKESNKLINSLKPKYREKPQFKLLGDIESVAKSNFRTTLKNTILKSLTIIK